MADSRVYVIALTLVIAIALFGQVATYTAMNNRLDVIEGRMLALEHRPVNYQQTAAPASDFSEVAQGALRSVITVRADNSEGSGVIFDERGYALTNRHVIEDSKKIYAVTADGKRYQAEVIAIAEDADLAVIKLRAPTALPTLAFADADEINLGMNVMAMGNPKGLEFTVSQGIVSAQERWIHGARYLQMDVSINPGNSGGPLVSSAGEVVGINTLKMRDTEGLSFAIPADIASAFAYSTVQQHEAATL